MKYLIRIIAILPAFSVGITSIFTFALSEEYHWAILLVITNLIAFIILLDKYEETVEDLVNMCRILCDKTLIYK